jgi:hypothetical protein
LLNTLKYTLNISFFQIKLNFQVHEIHWFLEDKNKNIDRTRTADTKNQVLNPITSAVVVFHIVCKLEDIYYVKLLFKHLSNASL